MSCFCGMQLLGGPDQSHGAIFPQPRNQRAGIRGGNLEVLHRSVRRGYARRIAASRRGRSCDSEHTPCLKIDSRVGPRLSGRNRELVVLRVQG